MPASLLKLENREHFQECPPHLLQLSYRLIETIKREQHRCLSVCLDLFFLLLLLIKVLSFVPEICLQFLLKESPVSTWRKQGKVKDRKTDSLVAKAR